MWVPEGSLVMGAPRGSDPHVMLGAALGDPELPQRARSHPQRVSARHRAHGQRGMQDIPRCSRSFGDQLVTRAL